MADEIILDSPNPIESFMCDYFNYAMSEQEAREYDSLLELFQGVCEGFYFDLCTINDGAYYMLSITPHGVRNWNVSDKHPSALPRENATNPDAPYLVGTHYRFETLAGALAALAAFQRAAVTDPHR